MVKYVSKTAQLELYDIHVSVIRTNPVLASKFKSTDFHEFEPSQKSIKFNGFPYFVLSFPEMSEEKMDFKRKLLNKQLSQEIKIHMEYEARDKAREYINATINAIEEGIETYRAAGYDEASIKFTLATPIVIHQKDIIELTFTFDCDMVVSTV